MTTPQQYDAIVIGASSARSVSPPHPASLWTHRSRQTVVPTSYILLSGRPALQDTGLVGPDNCSGSVREGRADPGCPTVS